MTKPARAARPAAAAEPAQPRTGADWALVGLISAVALLSGVLEVLLVPLYAGSVLVPLSAVLAVLGNLALPRLGFATIRMPAGALIPVLSWLVPVLALVVIARPEGDILVAGGGAQQWNYYAMVLLGGGAGFGSFVMAGSRAAAPTSTGTRGRAS